MMLYIRIAHINGCADAPHTAARNVSRAANHFPDQSVRIVAPVSRLIEDKPV